MPRPGQVKPETDERLSDRIAIGLLTRTFPPELVDRVVEESGKAGQRNRLLPPRVVVYFVLAMCLFSGQGYEEVARLLTQGLAWAKHWSGSWQVPTPGAVSRARARLGPEPLKALFEQSAGPVATESTPGAWYGCWRLMAVDGTTFDVPDSEENDARFGRPATHRGERTAFPQVRVVALAECGTHAITRAALGPFTTAESVIARELFDALGPDDLLMADRGFAGLEQWRAASAGGADLLWRIKSNAVLPVRRELPDGSYLSDIVAAKDHRKRTDPTVVRVIEYTLDDPGRPQHDAPYRLITTILDHEAAPAAELAALYNERWEIETTLDELKTHQRGPAQVLRSRSPDGVEQEVWAHLLVHHAIRQLMHTAARDTDTDTDRLSFTRTLRLALRQVTAQAAFSP
ncbi:IS4 family transposase [Streptomyces sp. NBC_01233]|uniref:IS4 family transposase n=1 Tax=Streptomyces sp. NBC_01233 TaxID=2903787 RepID=UPI002E125CCA|nr:IS4 family transposase [Streptomyces sp. NBC_01233]WSP94513.1 IS4 family transposase [Streptomyces sp. NBC_01233]